LAADVLSDGGGPIERQEDGGFELGLRALGLGFGNTVREAGPFTEGEVDEIIDLGYVVADKVDTPETMV
jgi:hypothetical protein